jgi:tRNA A37 methylthiotransferase MiaB
MGAFTYSREEGTAAYSFPHQIPGEDEEETARRADGVTERKSPTRTIRSGWAK